MDALGHSRALWIARNVLPHEPIIRARLSRWRLPPDLEPDDVVQEIYGRFALMPSVEIVRNPRAFSLTMARNIIISHVRHSRVVSIRAVDDLDSIGIAADEPSPEERTSDRQQLQQLADAVSELPETNRRVFLMRVMEERSHRDIGRCMGMSENAVQKSVAKSLVYLLSKLGRGGNPPAETSTVGHKRAGTIK